MKTVARRASLLWMAGMALVIGMAGCSGSTVGTPGKVDAPAAYAGAESGDFAAVFSALESGMQVNAKDDAGKTLLHHAVIGNQPKVVIKLIEEYKADPNIKDKTDKTPLNYAKEANNQRILQVLSVGGAKE